MDLSDFLHAHDGETAWIFGKGPSFSGFDFLQAKGIRCAINDVVGHVPDCKYAFANDGIKRWVDLYPQGIILFQPEKALAEFDSRNAINGDLVIYQDSYRDEIGSVDDIAKSPAVRHGTLGSAIQILHLMGINTIHLVGIDGGNSHAPGYKWRTRLRASHFKDYNNIRNDAIRIADELGITLIFHNTTNDMSNGKITVKILRSCIADGQPVEEGKTYDLNPQTAADLIAIRRAVAVDAPKKETASATLQEAENASIDTKKITKSKGK